MGPQAQGTFAFRVFAPLPAPLDADNQPNGEGNGQTLKEIDVRNAVQRYLL